MTKSVNGKWVVQVTIPCILQDPVRGFLELRNLTLEVSFHTALPQGFYYYPGFPVHLHVLFNMHLDKLVIIFIGGPESLPHILPRDYEEWKEEVAALSEEEAAIWWKEVHISYVVSVMILVFTAHITHYNRPPDATKPELHSVYVEEQEYVKKYIPYRPYANAP